MKHNFKGISLISVIITVLVIAILAAAMIPSGIDKINNAKLAAFNDNILTLKQEVNAYFMQNDEYPSRIDGSGDPVIYSIKEDLMLVAEATKKGEQNDIFYVIDLDKVKMDNKDIGVGKTINDFYIVAKISGNVYYAKGIKIANVVYYTKQNKGDGVIATVPSGAPIPNGAYDGIVNSPKLSAGMTAVKWNGSAWITADTNNKDNGWYDYTQGINRWANVKLADADASMLVWIPRYTYKIISGEHTSIQGVIDIRFSAGTKDDTTGGYRIHPAFYWGGWDIPASTPMTKQLGGTELTGIWVGKFESSSNGGKIKIVPNAASWMNQTADSIFTKCREMQTTNAATYGISTDINIIDTHMLKNSEWGAVAYLSKYALGNTEVAQNTSCITSGGNIVTNKAESTTGNEYGIFDMSGGAIDIVAAYTLSGNSYLSTYANSLLTASSKYKDVFPIAGSDLGADNYLAAKYAYGYGLYETSSTGEEGYNGWFGDYTQYPEDGYAMFGRGSYATGTLNNGLTIAGIFAFCFSPPSEDSYTGFRVSIIVP